MKRDFGDRGVSPSSYGSKGPEHIVPVTTLPILSILLCSPKLYLKLP